MRRAITVVLLISGLAAAQETSPAVTITRTYHASCTEGNKEVLVFGAADARESVATLKCGEKLTAINDDYASTPVRVRTKHGIEGYVSRANLNPYGYDPESDDNSNYVTQGTPQQKKVVTRECAAQAPIAPADFKFERDKTLPVVYYAPKHVPAKTPGGGFGAVLGATSWKIYPVIAYASTNERSLKVLGLRIDFGTGGQGQPLIPEELWFYVDEHRQFRRAVRSGDITRLSAFVNEYRIEWGGKDAEDFARTLATTDAVTMIVINQRLVHGRFDIKLKKSDLSAFAPAIAFYDSIPCPSGNSE